MADVALVTGGNRGIGFEICRGLAIRGMKVVLAARKQDDAAESAADLASATGSEIIPLQLDVTDEASVVAARDYITPAFSQLDVLVNNAGIYLDRGISLRDLPVDVLRQTYEVNVIGPLRMMQVFIPIMGGGGRIVNLSSRMGSLTQMGGGSPAYRSSKAALNALTRVAAAENPALRINTMHPGWVNTRMGGSGAPLTPEQGAETAIWLATLPADGPTGGFFSDRTEMPW